MSVESCVYADPEQIIYGSSLDLQVQQLSHGVQVECAVKEARQTVLEDYQTLSLVQYRHTTLHVEMLHR